MLLRRITCLIPRQHFSRLSRPCRPGSSRTHEAVLDSATRIPSARASGFEDMSSARPTCRPPPAVFHTQTSTRKTPPAKLHPQTSTGSRPPAHRPPAAKPEAQAEGSHAVRSANRIPSARASGFEDSSSARGRKNTQPPLPHHAITPHHCHHLSRKRGAEYAHGGGTPTRQTIKRLEGAGADS